MKPYFQNELITLYLGNCIEVTEWLKADVLVTDPPYGIDWKGTGNYIDGVRSPKWSAGIANDSSLEIRNQVLQLWNPKPAIVFGSWKMPRPINTKHRLIWHKKGQNPGPVKAPFISQDEEIYVLGEGFIATSPPMRSVIATTEERGNAVKKIGHPTPKPVGLMETLISRCPEGLIADPFAGSGSTLLAARNLGRKAIGIELEEKYCEIIANRLSQDAFDFGGI